MDLSKARIAIVGLGYVGMPLAVEFGKHRPVLSFDINTACIAELQAGRDSTLQVEPQDLAAISQWQLANNPTGPQGCKVFLRTTPMDQATRDLTPYNKPSHGLR